MEYPGSINTFSGGIVDDLREPQSDRFGISKHFDIFSSPERLTPYRSTTSEADATSASHLGTFDLRHFQLAKAGLMYALGNDGSAHPQVYQKTDPTTGLWSASSSGAGNAAIVYGTFIEWAGAFWMFSGTTNVSKWAIGGSFTNTVATLSTSIVTNAQGVIGADDNLYIPYNNRIIRVSNAGAVEDNVLANLPSDMRITSMCRYGTYLAIAMAYGTSAISSPTGASKLFIWDMVTTTTVNDVIDWGEGALEVVGNIEGSVVGVSNKFLETPSGLTSLAAGYGSMVVKVWSGAQPQVIKEVVANQNVTLGRFIRDVVVKDNKMYWVASVPLAPDSTSTESTYNLGIWAFGRKNTTHNLALTLDYIEEAVDANNFKIVSFGAAGNYWFINHSAAGLITKTANTATYSFTSIYESQIFNFIYGLRHRHFNDPSASKKLTSVTIELDPLPSGATVVVKYRADAETSWTTIFTHSTLSSLFHTSINIESTGATLPHYKEIQFRLESTGGGIITGFKWNFEFEPRDIHD